MNYLKTKDLLPALFILSLTIFSCKKDDNSTPTLDPVTTTSTLKVENISKPYSLVESNSFFGPGVSGLIEPGQSVTIHFSAAPGQALSFVTMYGWSNDLFFAPENPGISVYDGKGAPIQGDVSAQIKLWDNGTRINQAPGSGVTHPGTLDNQNITEVNDTDVQGNTYVAASSLINAKLVHSGNSNFVLTLTNISGGTSNETPLSPGMWAVSYLKGGVLSNPAPFYSKGKPTANGLTSLAETGSYRSLETYINTIKGFSTPLSPVLVVVYNGIRNPLYSLGEYDRDKGLKYLAQRGIADSVVAKLRLVSGVKSVYILSEPTTKILLPATSGGPGGFVSQQLSVTSGDRLLIATMYCFSNDWFFAPNEENGVDATIRGDISSSFSLWDDGTAVNEYFGAGSSQFYLGGTPIPEKKLITSYPTPHDASWFEVIANTIRVTLN